MSPAAPHWTPYREPLRATLLRTLTLALVGGLALCLAWGDLRQWPLAALLLLWPTLGGHFVELCFLNWLRPRLPVAPAARVAARLAVWFIGGAILALGLNLTAAALGGPRPQRPIPWWLGGLAFIPIELIAHLFLQLRGRPSFYNGRG